MNNYPIEAIRSGFPILSRTIYKTKPLIYFDNGATTQKPRVVLDKIVDTYSHTNANIHRGVHLLSQQATELYEQTRECVREFINASSSQEVIFTRGTTEAINLIATSFGARFIQEGDEIIISTMEHHANIVPWQMLCQRTGAKLQVIRITEQGDLDIQHYKGLFSERTRLVSVCHISNVLGTVNPIKELSAIAHQHNVPILVDGAQAIAHTPVDVQALDVDFYVFSAHKMYGPTGIGVLYGRRKLLEEIPPYMGGGEMIASVSFEGTTYNELPFKFEAGTPDYVGVIALAEAINYIKSIGLETIGCYEEGLLCYATQSLREQCPEVRIIGTSHNKGAILSFDIAGVHPFDLATLLDQMGIAIRTGHHCAEPLLKRYGYTSLARASLAMYNTREEIDSFIIALRKVISILQR